MWLLGAVRAGIEERQEKRLLDALEVERQCDN